MPTGTTTRRPRRAATAGAVSPDEQAVIEAEVRAALAREADAVTAAAVAGAEAAHAAEVDAEMEEAAEAEDIKALDHTDAGEQLARIKALEVSIQVLREQRQEAIDIVKELMGDATVGTIAGNPVVRWGWRNRTTVNAAKLRSISEAIFTRVSHSTRYREFKAL